MTSALLAKLTATLHPDRLAGLVTDGRVRCPSSSADVDVDRCYECRWFEKTIDGTAGQMWLRCRAMRIRPIYHL